MDARFFDKTDMTVTNRNLCQNSQQELTRMAYDPDYSPPVTVKRQ